MKSFSFFIAIFFFSTSTIFGQEFNKLINKDSIFQVIVNKLPEGNKKKEFVKMYNEGNDQTKEFFLVMFAMGMSSKKELIANIDSNFDKISLLKSEYLKLVPAGYIVSIEFNSPDVIVNTKESIDLTVRPNDQPSEFKQDWNLEPNSDKLSQMIKPLAWTNDTLDKIKKLLKDANCISIANGDVVTIGFARSGMGKYSFKLFNKNLTPEQIKDFNDGCNYIFYKDNIVLEYGGGAVGPQCFPKG